MILNLSFYIPYGPVGHPEASPLPFYLGRDKEDVERELYSSLAKRRAEQIIPSVFFDKDKSLEENGYFVLSVRNDEIDDEAIAALPRPAMFTPAAPGAPGRKLEHFKSHIPRFYRHFDYEVWEQGNWACDHDFGLETYRDAYKDADTGEILSEKELNDRAADITDFITVTCTRCGAVHALQEK